MADNDNGNTGLNSSSGEKKELSMEKRLLLAFGLMGLVLLGSQYLMPTQPAPPKVAETKAAEPAAPAQPAPAASNESKAQTPAAKPAAAAQPATVIADTVEKPGIVVETDVFKVIFTNRGATIRSWVLKNYKDSAGKPVELVNLAGEQKTGRPFSYAFRNRKPSADLNNALFQVKESPGQVEFNFSDGKTSAKKVFTFEKSMYRSRLVSEVTEGGQSLPHLLAWRGGFGDLTAHNAVSMMQGIYGDI